MAVQVFRTSRDTADTLLDRFSSRYVLVEMQSDRPGLAKLYWNIGSGYNEADSGSTLIRGGDGRWQLLKFSVPRNALLAVRFDPLRSEGEIQIRKIQLRSGSGHTLFAPELNTIQAGAQVKSLEVIGEVADVVFTAGANDPSLMFGAMIPDGTAGSVSLPWVGYLSVAGLTLGLFLLRRHTSGVVLSINVLRSSVTAWIAGLAVIDKPGPYTLAVGGLVVVALQVYFLYPLHDVIDLPIWDEAGIMGGGVEFVLGKGLGFLADSPLSKLIYAGLVGLFGPAGSIFANHYLVKTALVLVLFLFSARAAGSVLVGWVLSGLWALSSFQLEFPILTYQSALIWFGLGLLTIERNPILGLALVVLAALTRLEYQFAGILVIGILVVLLLRGRPCLPSLSRNGWILAGVACCLAFGALFNLSGWNTGTNRGWYAVKQHYALRLDHEGLFEGNNPFLEYGRVTDRDFPDADSLQDALRVNPNALINHVLWNIRHLPGSFLDLFVPIGADTKRYGLPVLAVGMVIATGLFVTCCSLGNAGRNLRLLALERPLTCVTILSGLLVIVPGAIVFAKSAYLLPVVPLGIALVAIIHRLGSKYEVINRAGVLCALLLVLTALLGGARPYLDRSRPRPVLATVAAIENVLPGEKPVVLLGVAASSFASYLGLRRIIPVEPLTSAVGKDVSIGDVQFSRLIEQHDPDLIMIDSNWRLFTGFDAEGAAALPLSGWREIPVPDGNLWMRPTPRIDFEK